MTDVTVDYWLSQIKEYANKEHWRCRIFVSKVEQKISDFQLVAYKMRGTGVSKYCLKEAARIKSELKKALR